MINFHDVRFPEDVSWGSSGGPIYKTQVFSSHQGFEKRNIDWAQPMMKFDVAYGIRTDVQITKVIEFFNARQGQLNGFRYKNWCDFEVIDSPIAVGDGYSRRLPLYKIYGFIGRWHYKRLRKIVRGSVSGIQVGIEPVVEGTDFMIDYNAGEIVFNDIVGYGTPVYAQRLEFDEPVRFEEDTLENVIEAYNNNSLSRLGLMGIRGNVATGSVFSPNMMEKGTEDPYFGRVVLLLNFDDGNADVTSTADGSLMAAPVVFSGSAQIDLTSYCHGNGSLNMGANGLVQIAGGAQDLSPGPFAIETFAKRPEDGALLQPMIARWDASTDQKSYMLRYNMQTKRLEFLLSSDGADERVVLSFPWEKTDQFDYIRVDRILPGDYVLRINGETVQTKRDLGAVFDGIAPCSIGSTPVLQSGEGPYQGRLDSIRLTAGSNRGAGYETIPVPAPYGRVGTKGVAANPSAINPSLLS